MAYSLAAGHKLPHQISAALASAKMKLAQGNPEGVKDAQAAKSMLDQAIIETRNQVAILQRSAPQAAPALAQQGQLLVAQRQAVEKAIGAIYTAAQGATGGLVQSPPQAGKYLRIPFVSDGDGATTAAQPYEVINSTAITTTTSTVTMSTPQLPYMEYQVVGFLIEIRKDAAARFDSVEVTRIQDIGGLNLLLFSGNNAALTFRKGDRHLIGLRAKPIILQNNQLQATLTGRSPGAIGVAAVPIGNSVVSISAVVHVIRDSVFRVNQQPLSDNAPLGGAFGAGYISPTGAPASGNIVSLPMTPATTALLNTNGNAVVYLGNGVTSVPMVTPSIPFARAQVVGFEIGTPIQAFSTDFPTVQDFTVNGGAGLFAQPGRIDVLDYLGDEGGAGGGMHTRSGLRGYPYLDRTNTVTTTLEIFNGLTDSTTALGQVMIPFVNVVLDVKDDGNLGSYPDSQYASMSAASMWLP